MCATVVGVRLLPVHGGEARVIPEMPPMMNWAMKPESIGTEARSPHRVPIQLKIFTPVGTPIRKLPVANAALAMSPSPVANMWCAHTVKPRKPMATPE